MYVFNVHAHTNRSPKFRLSFARLHELRALVPPGTLTIALTATVTPEIRADVITRLDIKGLSVCVCVIKPSKYLLLCEYLCRHRNGFFFFS